MDNLQCIVPKNLKLLFENRQLDIMKVLSLLQVLRNKSKKNSIQLKRLYFIIVW